MTYQEYKDKIKELQSKMAETEKEYLSYCPFAIGDRVIVTKRGEEVPCYIGKIRPGYFRDTPYNYDLLAEKKDGTKSNRGAGIYSYDLIRKA